MVYIPTVYFETTMFNYYIDTDRDAHPAAVDAFEAAGRGDCMGFTSTYTIDELESAPEPKRSEMLALTEKYHLHMFVRLWRLIMRTKDTIEEELDVIRDKIYEKIKDMTPEEECEYFNSRARETMKRYGIPFIKANPNPRPQVPLFERK